jgi:hypothetical protein
MYHRLQQFDTLANPMQFFSGDLVVRGIACIDISAAQ